MQRLNAHIAALAALTACALSAHSTAHAKGRTPKLSIYLTVEDGFSCSSLSLASADGSVDSSFLLSEMRYHRGSYSASLSLSAGDYELGGELSCDGDRFAVSPFSVSLSAKESLKQSLDVDFSAPIADPEPEVVDPEPEVVDPEPEVVDPEPSYSTCDSDEWTDSISALDIELSEANYLLQNARYYTVIGDPSSASERLAALEALLESMATSVGEITVDGSAQYTCQFYACPEAPEVAEVRGFSMPVFTADSLGLTGINPADQSAAVAQIDAAIEDISMARAHVYSEFKVLNTAEFYQCQFNVELTQLLSRQEELAQAATSEHSTDTDREKLQLEYALTSLEINRIAGPAGCEPSSVNGCDTEGSCPSISTLELATSALEDVAAALAEAEVCAPW